MGSDPRQKVFLRFASPAGAAPIANERERDRERDRETERQREPERANGGQKKQSKRRSPPFSVKRRSNLDRMPSTSTAMRGPSSRAYIRCWDRSPRRDPWGPLRRGTTSSSCGASQVCPANQLAPGLPEWGSGMPEWEPLSESIDCGFIDPEHLCGLHRDLLGWDPL